MNSAEQIASAMRESYKLDLLTAMTEPTKYFASRIESCYIPPRESDGVYDGRRLRDYQPTEHAVITSVLPDAKLIDVQVVTRADDQIIVLMTLSGTQCDGRPFRAPTTMVYDVKDGEIVRVTGLYDASKLSIFAEAFAAAAKTADVPITMTKERR